jgi:hypothetical protein
LGNKEEKTPEHLPFVRNFPLRRQFLCAERKRPPPPPGTARAMARRRTTEINVRPIYYGTNLMALRQEHRTYNNNTPPS